MLYSTFFFLSLTRLIKHTKQLLEENEERLCIKVLQTLREMMTKDRGYGEKVQALHVSAPRRFIGDAISIRLHIKIFPGTSGDEVSGPLRQITGSKM